MEKNNAICAILVSKKIKMLLGQLKPLAPEILWCASNYWRARAPKLSLPHSSSSGIELSWSLSTFFDSAGFIEFFFIVIVAGRPDLGKFALASVGLPPNSVVILWSLLFRSMFPLNVALVFGLVLVLVSDLFLILFYQLTHSQRPGDNVSSLTQLMLFDIDKIRINSINIKN